jgi:hypothetical protein
MKAKPISERSLAVPVGIFTLYNEGNSEFQNKLFQEDENKKYCGDNRDESNKGYIGHVVEVFKIEHCRRKCSVCSMMMDRDQHHVKGQTKEECDGEKKGANGLWANHIYV